MEKKYREVIESDIGEWIEISNAKDANEGTPWLSACLHKILTEDNKGRKYLVTIEGCWDLVRRARIELPPSYFKLHQASGLKTGDWVRITRAAKIHEQGWAAMWAPRMNNYVGSIAQITLDLPEYGFQIQGAGGFNYPAFVLEKVNHRPATKADEKATVTWDKRPDDEFTLHCVFTADDLSARAVIQNCDKNKRYSEGFLFAFLDDLSIHLPTEPQPPAEPDPAPQTRQPAPGLPPGWFLLNRDEVIQNGDKVGDKDFCYITAISSIGKTVAQWISECENGTAARFFEDHTNG